MHRRSLFLGVLVPLALLAGQLSTVVHSMVVEHQRCPEHGELVHRLPGPAPAPLPASDVGHLSLAPVAPVERHDHDHCLSLAGRREISGPPGRASADLGPLPPRAHPCDVPRSCDGRDALLGFAPKTSPPLRA